MTVTRTETTRTVLLSLVAGRAVLGVLALPLVPVLHRDHFVVLVLLRPTKDVLLAAGFLARRDRVELLEVAAAAVPLAVLGVWLFFWLGRSYASELHSGDALPGWAGRLLPPARVRALCRVLERKGRPVVVLGRLAAFPSSLLAAAAGASRMEARRFLPADALGGALSVGEVLLAGYALGAAYKRAGPWITAVGALVLLGLMVVVGRWLRREDGSERGSVRREERLAH